MNVVDAAELFALKWLILCCVKHCTVKKKQTFDNYFKIFAGFPESSVGKESTCNPGDPGWTLGWEDPLWKEKATHFSALTVQSVGSQRVGHD